MASGETVKYENNMLSSAAAQQSLQYLAQIDQLLVKQKKEAIEVITGWEGANKYNILNTLGQPVFYAKEKSSVWQRQLCGESRAFEMEVYDNNEQEVIHISRPLVCLCLDQGFSCMKCCQDNVRVECPPGVLVGTVQQVYDSWHPKYQVLDVNGQVVLNIKGPHECKCYCTSDIPFKVLSADGSIEVGRVSRQWSNLLQEMFTDADNFGISFPIDLAVEMKATIIGACFLIDFMYFEEKDKH